MRQRGLGPIVAAAAFFLLGGTASAADLSRRITHYSYRADRREMAVLLRHRQEAAARASEMVAAFRSQSPAEAVNTRLSSGETRHSTLVAANAVGGDQVARKEREQARFEARPPRADDPAIHMDPPDSLRALTAPFERVASSIGASSYYFYGYGR